jgi:hypothetical protein
VKKELIAPCGIYCGLCSAYLAYANDIAIKKGLITHCIGCKPRNKKCAYLKKNCSLLLNNEIDYCYECTEYPCRRLKHLDERYRKNYNYSLIECLNIIKENGDEFFLDKEKKENECKKCGSLISIHNKKCFHCDEIK